MKRSNRKKFRWQKTGLSIRKAVKMVKYVLFSAGQEPNHLLWARKGNSVPFTRNELICPLQILYTKPG